MSTSGPEFVPQSAGFDTGGNTFIGFLQRAAPAYLFWYVPLVFAGIAGWLDRVNVWLPVLGCGWVAALLVEFLLTRMQPHRLLPRAKVWRLFAGTTLVVISLVDMVSGVRALFAPLLVLWFIPAAQELPVRDTVIAGVTALAAYLAVNASVLTQAPLHPEYYPEAVGLMVLSALLFTSFGVVRRAEQARARDRSQSAHLSQAEAQIEALITQDTVTRALKREYFLQLLHREKARVDRYEGTFSVCIVGIDQYPELRQQHGDVVCVQILRELSERLAESVRVLDVVGQMEAESESVGRYGMAEFALLLPATDLAHAVECCDRLRRTLEITSLRTASGPIVITLSAGVSEYEKGMDIPTLLGHVEKAFISARTSGGDCVRAAGHTGAA